MQTLLRKSVRRVSTFSSIVSNKRVIPTCTLALPFLCLAVEIAMKKIDNLQFADSGGETGSA